MSTLPSSLVRVPNALSSRLMLGSITRSNLQMLRLQETMSSGKALNRPSDDPISTNAVALLDDTLERRDQRLRNLSHADAVLDTSDSALGELSNLLIEAKGIASSQIGIGSDEETRRNQALVIDAMLAETINLANSKFQDVHLFGGDATSRTPFVERLGGYRYQGEGAGLRTDIGLSRALGITVAGSEAFGAMSARVQGDRDLDPVLLPDTRVTDLEGARGLGVGLGTVNIDVGGTDITVDLTTAHTVQDIATALQTAIQAVDAGTTVGIDPVTGNRLEITGNAVAITITDPASPATAADLGIDTTFPPAGGTGADLDPRITDLTPLSTLTGVTVPLGTIRIGNMGQTRDVDLSSAQNVQDLMNLVHGLDIGVRVQIAGSGDRLDFVNELSGGQMSVAEVAGGSTATELGVRSYSDSTQLADFNDGRGIQIRTGSVDPVTGLPDPAADVDFAITTKDGTQVDVDLTGALTVQDVLDTINAAATAAGLTVGVDFQASLAADGNGIMVTDNTLPLGDPTVIASRNGSFAAQDLGLTGSTTGATFVSEDRATIAVDSLFTHLMALRDALTTNDERGITIAGEALEGDIARVVETRAAVGVRSRRVADATNREEDLRIKDTSLRSQLQDLDFTEAALQFSLLQTQLQAGLATAGRLSNLSLLDFLG